MARTKKGTNRIEVRDVEYRWVVRGDSGKLNVLAWPANDTGPAIRCRFGFHENDGPQIIVTNRIVRRVIDHALDTTDYNPLADGEDMAFPWIEDHVDWTDAVRANNG